MARSLLRIVLLLGLLVPMLAQAAPTRASIYAAAMRPAFAADVEDPTLPRYDLRITVDPKAGRIKGQLGLYVTNTSSATWGDLVLRLYPNFPRDFFGDGGDVRITVSDTKIGGVTVKSSLEAKNTVVRLPLREALRPGAAVDVSLAWEGTVKPWRKTDASLPLPSYYPMLAVWEKGWRTDVTSFPDRVYAQSALYHAWITVPDGYSVAASGSALGTSRSGGSVTTEVVTGPIREFALAVGRFATASASHDGTTITVFHQAGDKLDGAAQQIANHAAASLAVFNERFGGYPFRSLQFHVVNAGRGYDIGGEFPGLIFILLNKRYTNETRFVVAHEVAHQWFYGIIGSDIYRNPWLDESFAQFSPLLVEEELAGSMVDDVYQTHIAGLARHARLPAGLTIQQYGSWSVYYASVYGKGAQFLRTLRQTMGDAAFFAGMQAYVKENRYNISTPSAYRTAMQRQTRSDLAPLFKQWLGTE